MKALRLGDARVGPPARWIMPFVAVLLLVVAASPAAAASKSPAYQLAALDAEGSPSKAEVQLYKNVLESLGSKCRDKQRRLGDFAVKSQQILDKDGAGSFSLLQILQLVDASIPAGSGKQPCASVFAAWVVLTERSG
jgi:hypothetical protein